jgi:hypothetical protein
MLPFEWLHKRQYPLYLFQIINRKKRSFTITIVICWNKVSTLGFVRLIYFMCRRFSILSIIYTHTQNLLCLEFNFRIPTLILQRCYSGQSRAVCGRHRPGLRKLIRETRSNLSKVCHEEFPIHYTSVEPRSLHA